MAGSGGGGTNISEGILIISDVEAFESALDVTTGNGGDGLEGSGESTLGREAGGGGTAGRLWSALERRKPRRMAGSRKSGSRGTRFQSLEMALYEEKIYT